MMASRGSTFRLMSWLLCMATLAAGAAFAQSPPPAASEAELRQLLRATRFLDDYKASAAASAKVLAARGQGKDAAAAAILNKVATADLSPSEPCIARIFAMRGFTGAEATELTAFFASPLGRKVIDETQRAQLRNIAAMSSQPTASTAFSEQETRDLQAAYQRTSFRKYAAMATDPAAGQGFNQCIYAVVGVK